MNKEDIWVSRVPVPIRGTVDEPVENTFNDFQAGGLVKNWNIYSPLWAPVEVVDFPSKSNKSLRLEDRDRHDYAMAERVFPESLQVTVAVRLLADQNDRGQLYIEVWDPRGRIPVRLVLDSDGWIKVYHGRRTDSVVSYEPGKWYEIDLRIDVMRHQFEVTVNGQPTGSNQSYQGQPSQASGWYFLSSVHTVGRLVFRTGPVRRKPDVDSSVEDQLEDFLDVGVPDQAARYFINRVRTTDHRRI